MFQLLQSLYYIHDNVNRGWSYVQTETDRQTDRQRDQDIGAIHKCNKCNKQATVFLRGHIWCKS